MLGEEELRYKYLMMPDPQTVRLIRTSFTGEVVASDSVE